jgi:transposase-like protein
MKLIWLVLRNVEKRWKNRPIAWQAAKAQWAIRFEECEDCEQCKEHEERFLRTD